EMERRQWNGCALAGGVIGGAVGGAGAGIGGAEAGPDPGGAQIAGAAARRTVAGAAHRGLPRHRVWDPGQEPPPPPPTTRPLPPPRTLLPPPRHPHTGRSRPSMGLSSISTRPRCGRTARSAWITWRTR